MITPQASWEGVGAIIAKNAVNRVHEEVAEMFIPAVVAGRMTVEEIADDLYESDDEGDHADTEAILALIRTRSAARIAARSN